MAKNCLMTLLPTLTFDTFVKRGICVTKWVKEVLGVRRKIFNSANVNTKI